MLLLTDATNCHILKGVIYKMTGLKMPKNGLSKSHKKAAQTRKMFATVFNKQAGNSISTMDKLLKNIHADLDAPDFESKKLATDTMMKMLPYLLPRESNGNQMNVQINNSGGGEGGTSGVIDTIDKFLTKRIETIEEVKKRTSDKNKIQLRQVGVVNKKDDNG